MVKTGRNRSTMDNYKTIEPSNFEENSLIKSEFAIID
jgi:hypothetical protein